MRFRSVMPLPLLLLLGLLHGVRSQPKEEGTILPQIFPATYPLAPRFDDLVDRAGADKCHHYAAAKTSTTTMSNEDNKDDNDNSDNSGCNTNYAWMARNCARTCAQRRKIIKTAEGAAIRSVAEDHADLEYCLKYTGRGHCTSNKVWMDQHCATTCTYVLQSCVPWAQRNDCVTNPTFMHHVCPVACAAVQQHEAATQNATNVTDDNNSDVTPSKTPSKTEMEEEDDPNDNKYGITLGVDGTPFNMDTIRTRLAKYNEERDAAPSLADDETCTGHRETCAWTPTNNKSTRAARPGVNLPDNYPAKVVLASPMPGGKHVNNEYQLELVHDKYPELVESVKYLKSSTRHQQQKTFAGQPVAVKVVNFTGKRLKKMWDDQGRTPGGVYNGEISGKFGSRTTLMTYDGHTFHFVEAATGTPYKTITMQHDVHYLVLEPHDLTPHQQQVLETTNAVYRASKREERFMHEYYAEYGYPWLAKYGRPSPILNAWPADYVGQTHTISTPQQYWTCDEDPVNSTSCAPTPEQEWLPVNLTVVSHAGVGGPKVFLIPNLMSEAECDHILRLGKEVIRESSVGSGTESFKSKSRTSSTGWLPRKKSPILETLSLRFADVLGLDATTMEDYVAGKRGIAEQLQVVQYKTSQQYNPHHDFADSGVGYGQRYLTLLLYIQIPKTGGYTSFPKAYGGRGMKIQPPSRGGAVLFYSMLPDGNGDDLSLHGGDAVLSRDDEKWVCNLWIHDPDRDS